MHVRFEEDAEADIDEIEDYYVNNVSTKISERILLSLFTTIEQLESFPFLGKEGSVAGTRELQMTKYPYVVIYSVPDKYHVDIERVLHTSMQYPPEE